VYLLFSVPLSQTPGRWSKSAFDYKPGALLFESFLDFLLPPRCAVCTNEIGSPSSLIPPQLQRTICNSCCLKTNVDTRSENSCTRCGFKRQTSAFVAEDICPTCFLLPEEINSLHRLQTYEDLLELQIKRFKYHGEIALGRYFVELLLGYIESERLRTRRPLWDMIVAIPSSPRNLNFRGYSPTHIIASRLGRRLELPCRISALSSRRNRLPQVGLDEGARAENMRHAFAAKSSIVADKHILLLDDVITSGATVFEAARELANAGANSVDVLCVAESPRFLTHLMNTRDYNAC